MAEISPSAINAQIPLAAQTPKFDPLATVGQFNDVQKGLLSNRLLQGQFPIQAEEQKQAKIKTATDTQALTRSELDTFIKKAAPTASLLLGMVANKDQVPLTAENIKSGVVQNLFGTGALDARDPHDVQLTTAVLGQLQPGNTPDALAHNQMVLTRFYQTLNSTAEGYDLTLGAPSQVDTGSQIVQQQVSPVTGDIRVNAVTPKTVSPETAAALVKVWNPETQQYEYKPRAEVAPIGGVVGGGAGAPNRSGRYPGGGAGAGGAIAEPSPGVAMGMEQSTQAYQQAQAAVPQLKRTLSTFDQALDALKKAPTGQGSEVFQNLRAVADTLGLPLPQTEKGKTIAYAEANKWLTSALTQEASRLGLGTDQARQLAADAQPGVHTVHDAALAMVPVLKGLKGMELAQAVIAQRDGVKPGDFNAWSARWANSVDPMAFAPPRLTKDEWTAKKNSMEKAGTWDRYKAGLDAALASGVVTPAQIRK